MILPWLLLAALLPTLAGWFLLGLLESRTRVLLPLERLALGCLLGLTLAMFLTFLLEIAGLISFSRIGFLGVQAVLVLLLALLHRGQRKRTGVPVHQYILDPTPMPRVAKWIFGGLGVLAIAKLIAGYIILTNTPVYFDDVFKNWNMRAKMFYVTQEFVFDPLQSEDAALTGGLNSYPPTVSMVKASVATLAGRYEEGLVNAPHMLWALILLALLYCALRRRTTKFVATLGMFALAGMPLFFLHATAAYADLFLAAHVFAAVSLLYAGVAAEDPTRRAAFLRIGAVAAGLLVFTKNEAVLLYLPPLILLLLGSLGLLVRKNAMPRKEALRILAWYAGAIAAVAIPWIGFKIANGLEFGNAKAVSGFSFAWQPGVTYAIAYNTFLESNWILFFPLFLLLLLLERRAAFLSALAMLTLFFLIVYLGQLPLYLFTGLGTEAIRQTGYARGVLHIIPIGVMAMTLLLERVFVRSRDAASRVHA